MMPMQHKPIDFGNMEEGLDRQLLTPVQKRFLQVNRERLARAALALGPRENLLLDVLPLLFHVNHPSLPGFTHYDTPAGIHAYQPDAGVLRQIKTLSRAFQLQRGGPVTHAAIDALFLMGSPGTLGQSVHSDLDVWVCHRPGLASPELAKLRRKTDAISQWAAGEGIELHFFLMDAEAFKNGIQLELDNESSGSTQHRLLLDEFYRTALHLAGKLPLWWFVPAQQEHVYNTITHILLHRRFLRRDDVIDFGSTQPIPTAEFVSAATWQLYKAIDAPYKAILKLLLLEVYAEQLASGMTLAQQFKRAIYAGQLNVDELDPYLMLYRRLESYVQDKQQTERLDLLRRCFYFKVNQALSRRPPSAAGNWQRSSLQQLVATWGWTSNRLSQLDQRRQWKCLQVMREREVLIRELNGSYRYVHDLAGADDSRAQRQEMLVLGR
jgi:adenylate cyclase class 1